MITKSVSEVVAILSGLCPMFIVDDLAATLDFYCLKLGFIVAYRGDAENNFWAFVRRDRVMLMFKHIVPEIHPQPNHSRNPGARWDAYINTDDPDTLYREFVKRGVPMHRELADTGDGLRAFEVIDNNGYVLCFGCPRAA
jgi:catechol 2,3-dioxygenase-like lactoylglutathione lyase family enzyme